MACGATSAPAKPGSRSAALAMNSRTASEAAMSETPAAADGQSSGGTVQHTSPGTPSTTRLVTTIRSPSAPASSAAASVGHLVAQVLRAVEQQQPGRAASAAATDSSSGSLRLVVHAQAGGDRGGQRLRLAHGLQGDEHDVGRLARRAGGWPRRPAGSSRPRRGR